MQIIKIKARQNKALVVLICIVIFYTAASHAADIVLIKSAQASSPEQHKLELAAEFYGVTLIVVPRQAKYNNVDAQASKQTVALAIDADALARVEQRSVLQSLTNRCGRRVPILLFGLTPETDPKLLHAWSETAIGVRHLEGSPALTYMVGGAKSITLQLSNIRLPFPDKATNYFVFEEVNQPQQIMMVRNSSNTVPTFVMTDVDDKRVFLLAKAQPFDEGSANQSTDDVVSAFAELAPVMIFVKYCAGKQGWHAVHHYANFTIDDPWLRQPYGRLDYRGLLAEMDRHNFHTTIAFIPWNYSRSEENVVSLFRNRPDRFSICIHGDNHDHKEFEGLQDKPLSLQIAALKQALARMEKFQALTKVPYDRVFVFPHSIGTMETVKALKSYNYLATVNASNVPMDSVRPATPLFTLRTVTTAFADFPSALRYPAIMDDAEKVIAINAFLDNPILFYAHQDLFENGIDAFNRVADEVNRIEPATNWRNLGEIATNLYWIKQQDESNYDVLAMTDSLALTNDFGRDVVYRIRKHKEDISLIDSVNIGDQAVPFEVQSGTLEMRVAVPTGETRHIAIRYKNDLDLHTVNLAHDSVRVSLLREASDVRDIWLSRCSAGRAFTKLYYGPDVKGDDRKPLLACLLLLCCAAGIFSIVVHSRKRVRL